MYDVVVIGGGPAGYASALYAHNFGLKVALVEKERVGGTCLIRGCIPAKTWLQAAEVYHTVTSASTFGVNVSGDVTFDWGAGLERKNKIVEGLVRGLSGLLKQRNVDIGVISLKDAWAWGFSGVMVRGSGAAWDLRKAQPYECYSEMDFDIPIGKNGDCYGRYLVRVEEMRQSNRIIQQCVKWLRANPGPVITDNHKVAPPSREDMKSSIDRKSTRLNSSHVRTSRMPSSA